MKVCKRSVISGKVQGVYYRQATLEQATKLGVTGWVRNLASGEVECLACGDQEQVEALCEWFSEGPSAAHVENVTTEEVAWQDHSIFMIRR